MTKTLKKQLRLAKTDAAKNPPRELKNYLMNSGTSSNKKSVQKILLELRYGNSNETLCSARQ